MFVDWTKGGREVSGWSDGSFVFPLKHRVSRRIPLVFKSRVEGISTDAHGSSGGRNENATLSCPAASLWPVGHPSVTLLGRCHQVTRGHRQTFAYLDPALHRWVTQIHVVE